MNIRGLTYAQMLAMLERLGLKWETYGGTIRILNMQDAPQAQPQATSSDYVNRPKADPATLDRLPDEKAIADLVDAINAKLEERNR